MQQETAVKVAFFGIGAVLLVYAGLIALMVIVPIVVIAWIADFICKQQYNKALKDWRSHNGLEVVPQASLEVREDDDGTPFFGWDAVLPKGCYLEIYRMTQEVGPSASRVRETGVLLLTTQKERMDGETDIFYDLSAPEGMLYYVPVITGEREDQRACEYASGSFSSKLKFITKRQSLDKRGHSVVLHRTPAEEMPLTLPDNRSEIARNRDDILQAIETRKAEEQELDNAIAAIRNDDRFSDEEKDFAIAQLESRYEPE